MYDTKEYWDELYKDGKQFGDVNLILFDRILDRIEVLQGCRPTTALDLGSGSGTLVEVAASRGLQITGLDISEVGIGNARELLARQPELMDLVRFEQRDFNQVDESGEATKVDVVFMRLSFPFIKDRPRFFRYVTNSLTTNGVFVLMTPVLIDGYDYTDFMKLISVPLQTTEEIIGNAFKRVEVFNCTYEKQTMAFMTYLLSNN